MVTEITKSTEGIEQLLPERYPQRDLFICDVADAVLKDVMPQLEHPFYSLSKKPETQIRRYEHNGNWLEVTPSVKGLATIYDKDILIYCISQIIAAIKKGEKVSKRVRINCRDLLIFTNRGTAGPNYQAVCEAIDRLAGTRISTNIRTGDEEQYDNFGLIDAGSVRRKHGREGRLKYVEVELSEWVFNAIRAQEVLTLHRDYFRLKKPLERRIYEIARKHCGHQDQWGINLDTLLKKSGSQSPLKRFKQMVRHIAEHNHLPDYYVEFDAERNKVTFINRGGWAPRHKREEDIQQELLPGFAPNVYETAKKQAPSYDIYALEQEWRQWWIDSGSPELMNPPGAFIAFCKKRYESCPNP